MKAVSGEAEGVEPDTISELALAGIKHITQNAAITVDLHSAVYMFHFAQALIKNVPGNDAYNVHVGKQSLHIIFGANSKFGSKTNL